MASFQILKTEGNIIYMNEQTHKYSFKKKFNAAKFSVTQMEDDVVKSFYSNSWSLEPVLNVYTCELVEANALDCDKPLVLLCIKDDEDLLQFTLNNMKQNKVFDFANILIIDDRSENNRIRSIALESGCSYMHVVNTQNKFNFSMLHNLAVHAFRNKARHFKEIILWSSDLWVDNPATLPELHSRHTENKNTITGTKLLYPTKEFLHYKSDRINTVQFGGSMFGPRPKEVGIFALHLFRGYPKDDPKVNCDKGELFITAAFLIIDTKWFIETGGLCPSMKASYQDVDLCLRANEERKRVMYYGKDIYLYHYENYTLDNHRTTLEKQYESDKLWYRGFWEPDRVRKLLYVHEK